VFKRGIADRSHAIRKGDGGEGGAGGERPIADRGEAVRKADVGEVRTAGERIWRHGSDAFPRDCEGRVALVHRARAGTLIATKPRTARWPARPRRWWRGRRRRGRRRRRRILPRRFYHAEQQHA